MNRTDQPVVFVVPGDLHLTSADQVNYRVAQWMVDEVNDLIRPDFVQFIGDNVQDGTDEQFRLFHSLAGRLRCPWYALVGDHDAQGDGYAHRFRVWVGKSAGHTCLGGYRLVRLNTQEARPVGLSPEQLTWFGGQVKEAQAHGERVVVFQHNYPYKVWETFAGPGIDEWRAIVQTAPITAIFTGHTHYGQVANDGRNLVIATRSIGDPEGGPPGYTLALLHDNDLAVVYRTAEDRGPVVLITHPRDKLLATGPAHVVCGPDQVRVRVWSAEPVTVQARIDDGGWVSLEANGPRDWVFPLVGDRLTKGEHYVRVRAVDALGQTGEQVVEFMADATGRYTAVPAVRPAVAGTRFC
jgi:Icc protein